MFMIKVLDAVRIASVSNLNFMKNGKRLFSISKSSFEREELDENVDMLLEDKSYYDAFKEIPFGKLFGHAVLAIQPNMKDIPEKTKITNAELQLSELCALAESIPRWVVKEKQIHSLKRIDKKALFGKGKLEEVTQYVRRISGDITAVVIGINTLNSMQLKFLQDLWKLPVYDRYTMVLEIFRSRATTSEAKLQVALAEIHYLRMHLYGLHSHGLDFQKEGLKYIGGLVETTLETRKALLRDRETKIKKQIDKIGNQRSIMRENRKKMDIPVVAIVGYTNAGKTSLIKSLTGISKIKPMNQLFATLDINCFQGFLPNNIKVLYLDTVGFISDIPDSLLNAFSVTLEDVVHADLLVHVIDASHPDQRAQDIVVNKTLASLPSMPQKLLDNMIQAYNKVDLVCEDEQKNLQSENNSEKLLMSVTEGWGRQELLVEIQESLMKTTGRVTKRLRVPAGGTMLAWLYRETAVEEVIPDANDADMYLVKVVMTLPALSKFNAVFRPKNK